jgi:hypothetical protein
MTNSRVERGAPLAMGYGSLLTPSRRSSQVVGVQMSLGVMRSTQIENSVVLWHPERPVGIACGVDPRRNSLVERLTS